MTERIRAKMAEVRGAKRRVEENLPPSVDRFTGMGLEKDGIYKNVEHAIQAVYDICALVVKEEDLGVPSEERKLPDMLVEAGILDRELAERLKDMKGFRNHLAHRYGDIDNREAYENIQEGTEDFQKFLSMIEQYLEGRK